MSATYTTGHSNVGFLTHWARPGIEPTTSLFLVGSVNHCTTTGTPINTFFYLFFFFFLGLFRAAHAAPFPRLGVQSELQPQQCGTQVVSVAYTTAHSNTRSLTQWAKPGIEPASSWILVGFINCWAMKSIPHSYFLKEQNPRLILYFSLSLS